MEPDPKKIVKQQHHEREQLCTTRPSYRQGRKLTAVKVYTVVDESQHLLIRGVPALNLQKELKHLCMRYGDVKRIHQVKDYAEDEEAFTEVFHVLFAKIQSARFAKHMIDDKSFYGGVLHVCYAPELETITETRHKLDERRHEVLKRIRQYNAAELRESRNKNQSTNEPIPGMSGIGHQSSVSATPSYNYAQFVPPSGGVSCQPAAANINSLGYNEPIASTSGVSFQSSAQPCLPKEPQSNSRNSSQQPRTPYSQPSQPFSKPKVPISNPKPLVEAGITSREFIPRPTPKPKIGPDLKPTTKAEPSENNEAVSVKRNQSHLSDKFIPTQVKRIKFN